MKAAGAAIGYDNYTLSMPFEEDNDIFPIICRHPVRGIVSPTSCTPRQYAHTVLPQIGSLVDVMEQYHPTSPWVLTVKNMVNFLKPSILAGVPSVIPCANVQQPTSILRRGSGTNTNSCFVPSSHLALGGSCPGPVS